MRIGFILVILGLILSQIVYLFWREEYRYSLPTPIPVQFTKVATNSCVPIPSITDISVPRSGHMLHFYNPDCPCSRFNLKHFRQLYQAYREVIHFKVVIPADADIRKAQNQLGLSVEIIQDQGEQLATAYGVYSTPQAVIINQDGHLYFRGNYNKARFCTQATANYAQLSLDMLLLGQAAPSWGPLAENAYGCRFDGHQTEEAPLFFWSHLAAE